MKKFIFILMALVTGCSPKLLPVSNVQKDSVDVRHSDIRTLRDSIYIDRYTVIREKGDTVFVTNTATEYRDRWRDRYVHDTTYVKNDIEVVRPVLVEKELSKWQKGIMVVGYAALLIVFLVVMYFAVRIARKLII